MSEGVLLAIIGTFGAGLAVELLKRILPSQQEAGTNYQGIIKELRLNAEDTKQELERCRVRISQLEDSLNDMERKYRNVIFENERLSRQLEYMGKSQNPD